MTSKSVSPKKSTDKEKKDSLQWILTFSLIAAGIYANSYFSSVALPIRVAVGIVLTAVIIAVVGQTRKGRAAWAFIKGARAELRKVVWPSKQETTQTTLLVVVMVVIVAVILWGLDALFFWVVRLLSA